MHRPHSCPRADAALVSRLAGRWKSPSLEVRAHLGVETQRQWSDLALLRTTPALLRLFSLVTLIAHHLQPDLPLPQTAWYVKPLPTFVDALFIGALFTLEVPTFPDIYCCNGHGESATGATGVLD